MSIWASITKAVIGDGIGNNIINLLNKKAELKAQEKQQKLELEKAIHERRVELIKEGLHADAAWELEQIRNSGNKDEWVLFLLSIPLVLVFVPSLQDEVLNGFKVLQQTPDWYRFLVITIFGAIFGIRLYRRQQSDT